MGRDELVAALRAFLRDAERDGQAQPALLDPAGVELAQRLAEVAAPEEAEAWYLIGTLHWERYLALPEDQDQPDLEMAMAAFARLYPTTPQLVPDEFRSMFAATAPPPMDDAARWSDEAVAILQDPKAAGDLDALNWAVSLLRQAVAITPTNHRNWAVVGSNLGAALRIRFGRTGALSDLDAAVEAGRQAVAATPAGHAERAGRLSSLGAALATRFERTGELADLDAAVEAGRQAVAATPTDGSERAGRLSNLGAALQTRFGRTGALADLDEAVEAGRRAVAAAPTDHADRAGYLSNLGLALRARFERTGRLADLDAAVEAGRQAVAAVPTDHPDRAIHLSNLGLALQSRYGRTGALADLNAAVEINRQAVAAGPADHPDRARRLSNLGGALRIRFERTGALSDLDAAVETGRDAVAATPTDHPNRAGHLSNLGLALSTRFECTGALVDLDAAVEAGQQAVAATPTDHPDRAMYLSNLGGALLTRFERTGALVDLDAAVEAGQQVVAATPTDHPNRAAILSNLGLALSTRFERTGVLADLDAAVEVGRQAVAATPTDHPDRAMYLSNLGTALQDRFGRTDALADLDAAVEASQLAVAATPTDHPDRAMYLSNLGIALRNRSERTGAKRDRRQAVTSFRLGATVRSASPLWRARCGRSWARLVAQAAEWAEARRALVGVWEHLPVLTDHGLGPADRRHHLSQLEGLGAFGALVALRDGRLRAGRRRAEDAWEALEAGRAVLIGQALETRTDLSDLAAAHPDLAIEVRRLRSVLNRDSGAAIGGASGFQADGEAREHGRRLTEERREVAREWESLLAQVRATPGFERFALPPTLAQMRQAAGGGTIVAIAVTEFGGAALTLTSTGTSYLMLPRLTQDTAIEQANRFLAAIRQPQAADSTAVLHEVLAWLWDEATGPILTHLGHERTPAPGRPWPRIWWIPTGALSVLPLHSAGHYQDADGPGRRSVLDRVVSSYTPTVRALLQAGQRRPHRSGALFVGINQAPGQNPLIGAEAEVTEARRLVGAPEEPVLAEKATFEAVSTALAGAGWAHFALHALPDQEDPADSFLALHDKPLRVRELGGLEPADRYLAYLSACTTAVGALDLLDEPIHLASAFQLAGFQHTIATLWPIRDTTARRITPRIYRRLAAGVEPAIAVHEAVREVRANPVAGQTPYLWASHIHFGP